MFRKIPEDTDFDDIFESFFKRKARSSPLETSGDLASKRIYQAIRRVPRSFFYKEIPARDDGESIRFFSDGNTTRESASLRIVYLFLENLKLNRDDNVLIIGAKGGFLEFLVAMLSGDVHVIDANSNVIAITERNVGIGTKKVKDALQLNVWGLAFHTQERPLLGYPDEMPYNAIIVTAAIVSDPADLFDQLSDGGKLIAPIGPAFGHQQLVLFTKDGNRIRRQPVLNVSFSPLDLGKVAKVKGSVGAIPLRTVRQPQQRTPAGDERQAVPTPRRPASTRVPDSATRARNAAADDEALEKLMSICKKITSCKLTDVASSIGVRRDRLMKYLQELSLLDEIDFRIEGDMIFFSRVPSATPVDVRRAAKRGSTPPFKAYDGNEPYMFVSYAHHDKEEVFPLLKRLNESGVRIWYDDGIHPGEDWTGVIAHKLKNPQCRSFMVFLTEISINRENVLNEIHLATQQRDDGLNTQKIPVNLDDVETTAEINYKLGRFQHIYRKRLPPEEFAQKLMTAPSPDVRESTASLDRRARRY
ncbi:MAG: TIR domain-containing protein [Candidatus Lokiarchaeota archaeon]|nr:TIR domain-containing protein [Candidatus Lokiarchaeota archaeon]